MTAQSGDSVASSENPRGDLWQAGALPQVLATIFQRRRGWLDRRRRDSSAVSRSAFWLRHSDLARQLLHPLATPHRHIRVESRSRGAAEAQPQAFGSDCERAAASRPQRVQSFRRDCRGPASDASELLSKCRVGSARVSSYPFDIRMQRWPQCPKLHYQFWRGQHTLPLPYWCVVLFGGARRWMPRLLMWDLWWL